MIRFTISLHRRRRTFTLYDGYDPSLTAAVAQVALDAIRCMPPDVHLTFDVDGDNAAWVTSKWFSVLALNFLQRVWEHGPD